ncbi:MAG: IclR family transcriptional regulator [Eubacteriales bacterium]|nr:IclR family transcriptional regulator [Eubacteriales bacterium]
MIVKQKFERIAPIQSVERAIWILKCFEENSELSLSEISHILSLHKSTAFGLVSSLEAYRLVEQDQSSGKYHLGIGLFRLGSKVNIDLRSIVTPYLDQLVGISGETVNFVIPDGNCVIYLEKKESPHSMRIATTLGQREPMYRTSTGKAILANLPLPMARSILECTKFERSTSNTHLSVGDVLQELNEIRQRGYAVDQEELEYGLVCIGSCVFDSTGKPVGAISISGPTLRMTEEKRNQFAVCLMDCCRQISSHL